MLRELDRSHDRSKRDSKASTVLRYTINCWNICLRLSRLFVEIQEVKIKFSDAHNLLREI